MITPSLGQKLASVTVSPKEQGKTLAEALAILAAKKAAVIRAHPKTFGPFRVTPSNILPAYQGTHGELIPCIACDEHGHYVTAMDIPTIILDSLPIAE